jgi:hypothetical protein
VYPRSQAVFSLRWRRIFRELAIALLLCASANPATLHNTESPPAPSDDRGTDSRPLVIRGNVSTSLPPPPTKEQIEAARHKAQDDHRLTVATEELAWLTGALAAIALLQLVAFIWQLRLTERTARDAEQAANAARVSAEALPKIERAYVFVEVLFAGGVPIEDGRFGLDFIVRFTNHGKTPAIITLTRAYTLWSETPPTELVRTERAQREVPQGMVIGADGNYDLPLREVIDGGEWGDIHDVVRRLYIVGVMEYEDVMGVSHRTGFCWHTYPLEGEIRTSISPSPLNSFE